MSICSSKFFFRQLACWNNEFFFQPESVKLCIDMLDEYVLRSSKIHVERAKFEVKGTYNPDLKRKRKKVDKKGQKQQMEKLFDWEERPEVVRPKYERIVAMKNMFQLEQFKVSLFILLNFSKFILEFLE